MGSWRGLWSLQLSLWESKYLIPFCSKRPYRGLKAKPLSVPPARGISVLSKEGARGKLFHLRPCPGRSSVGSSLTDSRCKHASWLRPWQCKLFTGGTGLSHGEEGPDRAIPKCQFLQPASSPTCMFLTYLEKLILGMYTQITVVGSTEICREGSMLCIKAVVIHLLLAHQRQALRTFWIPALKILQACLPSGCPHWSHCCTTAVGFPLCLVTWLLLLETAPLSRSAPQV